MATTSVPKAAGGVLTFSAMTDLGIKNGFDLAYGLKNAAAEAFLLVGHKDNRIKITGTTPLSRRDAVLKAIDSHGKWGEAIDLWMIAEQGGKAVETAGPVKYKTHVRPYGGDLTIGAISKADPPLVYPGNGSGRLLSEKINDCYYFIYGGKLETDPGMRGFDCTSFPMALFSIKKLTPPGYGKQVCDALSAKPCGLEQLKSVVLRKKFAEDTIPVGYYVLFSEGHVLLYNSYANVLHEFNYGGYKATPAAQRALTAPRDLWWMRKLPDEYQSYFS